ncbi:MAG: hypothetical protein V4604_10455 [Bacteroidota bacterium]
MIATNLRTDLFYDQLVRESGCSEYLFTTNPLLVPNGLFQRLNKAVPAMLDLLDGDDYWHYCLQQQQWSLKPHPMKTTDFTGCADFLVTSEGAKLIEMNINLPGKIGLIQTLGEATQQLFGDEYKGYTNLNALDLLLETIRTALPTEVPIAILVSHLPASDKHQAHYRYFADELNRLGLNTTVVPAREVTITATGCTWNDREFGAFINLVIPFVWEGNQDVFQPLNALWEQYPDLFFPNPTGGMFGTKELLHYLDAQRHQPNASLWTDFVLRANMFSDFDSVDALLEAYQPHEMVLKPLKDYDTKGVYVQPDRALVEQLFAERKADYMVQEFTSSVQLPFENEAGERLLSHSLIYRIFFASKQPIAYQGYVIHGEFNGTYYSAPVIAVN